MNLTSEAFQAYAFYIFSAGIDSMVLFSVVLQEPVQVQAEDMPTVPAHSLPLRAGGQGDQIYSFSFYFFNF
jgi:hypothetical protein